ncbi:hypothetical protein GQ53DRAFT_220652 [Thozetella sp. PMI_491]|nr:hypothetical protein GQ53DRAFT_220652 [Thozetella sp. PMI_491]
MAAKMCHRARTSLTDLYHHRDLAAIPLTLLFSSLALFAFWLRSSVVSVLTSLISSSTPMELESDYPNFLLVGGAFLWACLRSRLTVSLVLHCLQATRTPVISDIFSLQS